jgi:hypothetical protein
VGDSGRKVIYLKENWDTNPREKVRGAGEVGRNLRQKRG